MTLAGALLLDFDGLIMDTETTDFDSLAARSLDAVLQARDRAPR